MMVLIVGKFLLIMPFTPGSVVIKCAEIGLSICEPELDFRGVI